MYIYSYSIAPRTREGYYHYTGGVEAKSFLYLQLKSILKHFILGSNKKEPGIWSVCWSSLVGNQVAWPRASEAFLWQDSRHISQKVCRCTSDHSCKYLIAIEDGSCIIWVRALTGSRVGILVGLMINCDYGLNFGLILSRCRPRKFHLGHGTGRVSKL